MPPRMMMVRLRLVLIISAMLAVGACDRSALTAGVHDSRLFRAAVRRLLPRGMPEDVAVTKLEHEGFTCAESDTLPTEEPDTLGDGSAGASPAGSDSSDASDSDLTILLCDKRAPWRLGQTARRHYSIIVLARGPRVAEVRAGTYVVVPDNRQ